MVDATFRFHEELNDFLAPARRGLAFTVPCAQAATTKHMIEALGRKNGVRHDICAKSLRISKGDTNVTIRDWQPGELGIETGDGTTPVPPAADRLIVGDLAPVDFNATEPGVQTQTDDLGNVIVGGEAEPGREDYLNDGVGNDHMMGLDGNDLLYASLGGDNILEGGAGSDILISREGEDRLYADDKTDDLDLAILLGDTDIGSGLKGDLLGSGEGDDIVMGSQGNDTLLGGGGRDLIIAGAGDDNIVGDGHVTIYEGNNTWDVVREIVPMTPENGQTGDQHIMHWQEAWSTYPEAVKTTNQRGHLRVSFCGSIGYANRFWILNGSGRRSMMSSKNNVMLTPLVRGAEPYYAGWDTGAANDAEWRTAA